MKHIFLCPLLFYNFIKNILDYFLQVIDYKIDEDTFKINIFIKYKELVASGIVKKIDIRYFFGLFRYNIDFKDKNVFIVHAPNGCGKTNLLKIINDFFNKTNNFYLNDYKEMIKLLVDEVDNKNQNKINLKNAFFDSMEITIQDRDSDNCFITYRKDGSNDLYLKNKVLTKCNYLNEIECIFLMDLQSSNKLNIIFLTESLFTKDDIIARKVDRFNEVMKIFFCFEKSVILELNKLVNWIKHSDSSLIDDISCLLDIRYKEKNDRNVPGVFGYNQKIDFDMLSTGEKNLIRIFLRLIFETKYGSLVLLDEPEISLHIEWQVLLIKNIVKLAEEFNLKFLIATHSPYIADNPDVIVGRAENE